MIFRICVLLTAILFLSACGDFSGSDSVPDNKEARQGSQNPVTDEHPVMGPKRTILAFGDSLFAGYNVASQDSYPAKLEASLRVRGINAQVINAGVSGDTSAAGLQRLAFTLDAQDTVPDLVLLELGGNDLLRGLPVEETKANLSAILTELDKRKIPVLLVGMRAPPNLGQDYQTRFDAIYPDLAKQYNTAYLPFFLEPVYNRPELVQPDHIHPTERGIEELVGASAQYVVDALPATGGTSAGKQEVAP
ncbi:MAG: arylesterase [Sphingomonadaceae bacterium]